MACVWPSLVKTQPLAPSDTQNELFGVNAAHRQRLLHDIDTRGRHLRGAQLKSFQVGKRLEVLQPGVAHRGPAQVKQPENRAETVGRQVCEAVGGKLVGGWLSFGDYDLVIIADVPNNESMAAIALAVATGGGFKASKTTVLMTGTEGVGALKKAEVVGKTYKPAR